MSRILQKTIHWLKKAGRGFTNLYRGPWYKKTVVWATTCVLSVILLLIAVDLNFLYLFGKSPGFKDIKNPVTNEASEIYSADSVLIGRFSARTELRSSTKISPPLSSRPSSILKTNVFTVTMV